MNFRRLAFFSLTLIFFTGCASTPEQESSNPQPQTARNEVLHNSIPGNYGLGYKTQNGNMILKEYVPKGETVENWTEMFTVQTYVGMVNVSPRKFASMIKGMGKKVCPGIKSTVGEENIQNGYNVFNWKQVCPLNPNTKRPEATLIKAFAGNENLYTIQKAWAYYPTEAETLEWQNFLKKVMVCDTGIPERPCPKGNIGDPGVE